MNVPAQAPRHSQTGLVPLFFSMLWVTPLFSLLTDMPFALLYLFSSSAFMSLAPKSECPHPAIAIILSSFDADAFNRNEEKWASVRADLVFGILNHNFHFRKKNGSGKRIHPVVGSSLNGYEIWLRVDSLELPLCLAVNSRPFFENKFRELLSRKTSLLFHSLSL